MPVGPPLTPAQRVSYDIPEDFGDVVGLGPNGLPLISYSNLHGPMEVHESALTDAQLAKYQLLQQQDAQAREEAKNITGYNADKPGEPLITSDNRQIAVQPASQLKVPASYAMPPQPVQPAAVPPPQAAPVRPVFAVAPGACEGGVVGMAEGGVTEDAPEGQEYDPSKDALAADLSTKSGRQSAVADAATNAGLAPHYALAQIEAESKFNPKAESSAGAQGMAQLMPETAARFGVKDPFDPAQAIKGHTQYMKFLTDHYQGDQDKALAAYNTGEGNLDHIIAKHGEDWKNHLPAETSKYLSDIEASANGKWLKYVGGEQEADVAPEHMDIEDGTTLTAHPGLPGSEGVGPPVSSAAPTQPGDEAEADAQAAANPAAPGDEPVQPAAPGTDQNTDPNSDPNAIPPVAVPPVGQDQENAYQQGTNLQLQGGQALANAQGHLGQQKAGIAQNLATGLQQQIQDEQRSWAQAKATSEQQMGQYAQAMQRVANMRVDPNHWYESRSAGQQALGFLGIMLSGLSGSQHNFALEGMDKAIERDIDAQKANIDNSRHAAEGYKNLYDMNMNIFKDDQAARLATKGMMLDQAGQQALSFEGQAAGPIAQATNQQVAGALQQKAIENKQMAAQRAIEVEKGRIDLKNQQDMLNATHEAFHGDASGQQGALSYLAMRGDKTIIPVGGKYVKATSEDAAKKVQDIESSTNALQAAFDDAIAFRKMHGGTFPGSPLNAEANRLTANLQTRLKETDEKGVSMRYNENTKPLYDALVHNVGSWDMWGDRTLSLLIHGRDAVQASKDAAIAPHLWRAPSQGNIGGKKLSAQQKQDLLKMK